MNYASEKAEDDGIVIPMPDKAEARTELVSVRLTGLQKKVLKRASKELRMRMAEILRPAVDAVIERLSEEQVSKKRVS